MVYTPLTAPNLSPQRALAEAVSGGGQSATAAVAALPYFEAVEQCLRDAAYDHNWRPRLDGLV